MLYILIDFHMCVCVYFIIEHGYPLPAPTVRRRKEIKLHPHGKFYDLFFCVVLDLLSSMPYHNLLYSMYYTI